jgi:hypothetical protein
MASRLFTRNGILRRFAPQNDKFGGVNLTNTIRGDFQTSEVSETSEVFFCGGGLADARAAFFHGFFISTYPLSMSFSWLL